MPPTEKRFDFVVARFACGPSPGINDFLLLDWHAVCKPEAGVSESPGKTSISESNGNFTGRGFLSGYVKVSRGRFVFSILGYADSNPVEHSAP